MANRKPSQSWDNLRYFLAVARTGTLSAAAEQLGTEHTTVARHIHALEEELNSRLFHRSNSGYGLTEVGERLFTGAEAIESAYTSAKAAANNEGQTIGGTVRIGTPDGFGSLFLAPRVRLLADRHPKLEIEILTTARRQFSPAEARSGYRYRPFGAGAHAPRLQAPHRLPAVCLRLARLSGEGSADRHSAGSQEPPLHRLCRRAVVFASAQF